MSVNMSYSEEARYYRTKYEFIKIIAIVLAAAVLFFFAKSSNLETKLEYWESEAIEAKDWIERNYKDTENSPAEPYSNNEDKTSIEDMDVDEIIDYVEAVTCEEIFWGEDAHAFAVYAFQKGYDNRKKGIWDEMTQELIEGYEFTPSDARQYLNMLY